MSEMFWLVLIIIHILLTLIVYLIVWKQSGRVQAFTEAGIVFLTPGAGFITICIARIIKTFHSLQANIDPHLLRNENDVFTNLISYDDNVIPLNDTFLLDDLKLRRKVFLDAVKQNVLDNASVLRMATHDSDREIAYYAVSMASGHIEKLEDSMADIRNRLEEEPGNLELLQEYLKMLEDYLGQEFVDDITKKETRKIYVQVVNRLLYKDPDNMYYLQGKINQQLLLEDYDAAEQTCAFFQYRFPDREEPYIAYIKLYVALHDFKRLQKKLEEMKRIPAELSLEALTLVRYWGEAARAVRA